MKYLAPLLAAFAWHDAQAFWWDFLKNALSYPKKEITQYEWYQPREVVHGNREGDHFLTGSIDELKINPDVISDVLNYAETTHSLALIIAHKDKIVLERYWGTFARDSYFNPTSMTKTINSLLIGQLIADGRIHSEEDSASLYLPEWKVPDKRAITIKHLLRMESGLSTGTSYQTGIPWLIQMHLGTDILYYVSHLSITSPPGQQFDYNNMNAQALGLVIQNASGRRYSEFLSEKLWTKIGASDASVWIDRENGIARTYCCLFSRPRDWVKVGFLLLNQGEVGRQQLVSKKWINKMLAPSPFEPEYGYSIWLGNSRGHFKREKNERSEDFIAKDLFFLDGRGKQRVYVLPSQELVIVRIGESSKNWDDAYIPNTILRGLIKNSN